MNKCESPIKLYFSGVTIAPDADGDGFEKNIEIIDNTNENTWDLTINASLSSWYDEDFPTLNNPDPNVMLKISYDCTTEIQEVSVMIYLDSYSS